MTTSKADESSFNEYDDGDVVECVEADDDTQLRNGAGQSMSASSQSDISELSYEDDIAAEQVITLTDIASVDETNVRSTDNADHNAEPIKKHLNRHTKGSDTSKLSFLARIDKVAERQRLRSQPQGKILRDRFCLIKTLGSGGMGDVYLAKDLLREEMEDSSPYIALKLLNEECQSFPGALQALQREAKKAQSLSHPNIVTVFDFDRCGDTAFITMEYLQGQTVKEYLADNGSMSFSRAMQIIELAARGLAYAHQKGFIHADIKPANVFMQTDGNVKILDFGIARAVNQVHEPKSVGDELTAFALTPNYATVASLKGNLASEKDDIFALACVAYQLMTGRHPYTTPQGLPLSSLDAQRLGMRVENIVGLNHRHMRALRKALRFDVDNGFNNAGEFIDAIKPRNHKKTVFSFAAAAVLAVTAWVVAQAYFDSRIPSLDSLPANLAPISELIREGDRSLRADDIDLAHRLYSQAWFDTQTTLDVKNRDELDKLRHIISQRVERVVTALLDRANNPELTEFEIREYLAALEFFTKTEFISQPYRIRKAITDLSERLENYP